MMKIQPVTWRQTPKYPDKYSVDLNHMLLYYRPKRWLYRPVIGTTLAAVVSLGLSACAPDGSAASAASVSPSLESNKRQPAAMINIAAKKTFPPYEADAPIPFFEHGYGVGGVGCVSIYAPVYLSEEEAMQIIIAELEKAEIEYTLDTEKTPNVIYPITEPEMHQDEGKRMLKGSFTFDAQVLPNSDKPINLEYVSTDDYYQWRNRAYDGRSSAIYIDPKSAAQVIQRKNANTVALYDPFNEAEYNYNLTKAQQKLSGARQQAILDQREEKGAAAAMKRSRKELREQVLDFIAWLKAAEII